MLSLKDADLHIPAEAELTTFPLSSVLGLPFGWEKVESGEINGAAFRLTYDLQSKLSHQGIWLRRTRHVDWSDWLMI